MNIKRFIINCFLIPWLALPTPSFAIRNATENVSTAPASDGPQINESEKANVQSAVNQYLAAKSEPEKKSALERLRNVLSPIEARGVKLGLSPSVLSDHQIDQKLADWKNAAFSAGSKQAATKMVAGSLSDIVAGGVLACLVGLGIGYAAAGGKNCSSSSPAIIQIAPTAVK